MHNIVCWLWQRLHLLVSMFGFCEQFKCSFDHFFQVTSAILKWLSYFVIRHMFKHERKRCCYDDFIYIYSHGCNLIFYSYDTFSPMYWCTVCSIHHEWYDSITGCRRWNQDPEYHTNYMRLELTYITFPSYSISSWLCICLISEIKTKHFWKNILCES